MDTITGHTLLKAADIVNEALREHEEIEIHTVTIELSGNHGGADLTIHGHKTIPGSSFYRYVVIEREIH